jgi:hypothetical protein
MARKNEAALPAVKGANKGMKVEYVLAMITFLGSVIVSWGTAYYVSKSALQKEEQNGGARLAEICRRYMVNFLNAYDRHSRKLRTDSLAYEFYTQELQHVVDDLDGLLANAYVEKLIFQYPKVTNLLVTLRREIIEHRTKGAPLRGMNVGSLNEVFGLHKQLRADFSTSIGKTDFDQDLVKLEIVLRSAGMLDLPPPSPLAGDAPQVPRP